MIKARATPSVATATTIAVSISTWGKRIDIIHRGNRMIPRAVGVLDNRDSGLVFGADRNEKQDDGGLQNVHSDDLFNQVVFDDHGIQADHHQ